MGTGGTRGRCGTDCHCESLGSGMERDAHDCRSCRLAAGVSVLALSCRPAAERAQTAGAGHWYPHRATDKKAPHLPAALPPQQSGDQHMAAPAPCTAGPAGAFPARPPPAPCCTHPGAAAALRGSPWTCPRAAAAAAGRRRRARPAPALPAQGPAPPRASATATPPPPPPRWACRWAAPGWAAQPGPAGGSRLRAAGRRGAGSGGHMHACCRTHPPGAPRTLAAPDGCGQEETPHDPFTSC